MFPTDDTLLAALAALAVRAGREILAVAANGFEVVAKADASPVTVADQRAEAVILAGLATILPGVPVVAEEQVSAGLAPSEIGRRFVLVDPLDGTREFVSGNGEYTVNIGLVEDGRPILGVVHAPALGEIHVGRVGAGAAKGRIEADGSIVWAPIAVRGADLARLTVLASRSHGGADTEAYLAQLAGAERLPAGSSLKFCRVAEGEADLYPRLGPTMEWDTAAGAAVLDAAGGRVLDLAGTPLVYGRHGARRPQGWFVAIGDAAVLEPALVAARACGFAAGTAEIGE